MRREEKIMIQKLQGKYSGYLEKLSSSLSKPEKNFLRDSCFGILSSQSCIVRRSAQSLHEKISSKKTQERLIYHLDKPELNKKISETLLQRQCRKLNKSSLILIDPSDIVKKYAKKMEGLSKVRDGNDGKWKTGYEALDIVGVNTEDNNLSVFPIHSQLHSNTVEIDTIKNNLFDRIVDIIVHSNNRGTFIFDREFDDKKVIKELDQHNASYIIRMKKNRDVYRDGRKQNIKNVAENTKLRYRFRPQKSVTISAGITSINIPLNPHPVKNPTFAETRLVVARIRSKDKKGKLRSGMFYLLCNLPENKMHNREFVKFVLESYKLRWKIEEVHRQVKTDFGWEDIQLQTYGRLQFMNTLLWVAMSFLYELDKWKYQITKAFTNLMLEKKNKLSELYDFVYYRLAVVVKYCFNQVRMYRKLNYYKRNYKPLQLWVSFF